MYSNFQNIAILKVFFNDQENISVSETTKLDPYDALKYELNDLFITDINNENIEKEIDAFLQLFKIFLKGSNTSIIWDEIHLVPDSEIIHCDDLQTPGHGEIHKLLNSLVVLKLNGGLGTSMGCVGPKSVINVRDDLTFLDMTVKQIETLNNNYDTDVPLVLMNSFNTEEDTRKVINRYKDSNVKIFMFMQKKFPRILKDTMMPMAKSLNPIDPEAWYPPGHGDIYNSFYSCGLLDMFIENKKSWLFVSNVDNLGATVDLSILKELETIKKCDFMMEVTRKTRADVKGGTLIYYNKKLTLLELAQVPKDKIDEFKSIQKFKIFNTNNLWINLSKMKSLVTNNELNMEVIVNPKTLDNGQIIIQLEQAAGAAIKNFDNAIGILVPRCRFLPVKTTSDLLLVKSNMYQFGEGQLTLSTLRKYPELPLIKLGPRFKSVKAFLSRFSEVPDLLELDHLTVFGDIKFGKDISLRGTVIIIAQEGDHIDIPSGSTLENKIITGNLHILDH